MKSTNAPILKHLTAVKIFEALFWVATKLHMEKWKNTLRLYRAVSIFNESFGNGVQKAIFRYPALSLFLPCWLLIAIIFISGFDWLFFAIFTIAPFVWLHSFASLSMESIFKAHATVVSKILKSDNDNTVLQTKAYDHDFVCEKMKDVQFRLIEEHWLLQKHPKLAQQKLDYHEKMGTYGINEVSEAIEEGDREKTMRKIHEHFPEIFDILFTRFSFVSIQIEDAIYIATEQDFREYFLEFITRCENVSPFIIKEDKGSITVNEKGELEF